MTHEVSDRLSPTKVRWGPVTLGAYAGPVCYAGLANPELGGPRRQLAPERRPRWEVMPVVIDHKGLETQAIHSLVDFRGRRVIEIGSGDGRMTFFFAEQAAHVVAVEPLPHLVRRAIDRAPDHLSSKVRFVAADATTWRYPTSAFDIAVFSHSL